MDLGKRLVIHAGLHKTGTTSFQAFCRRNSDLLEKFGVIYPRVRSYEQHHLLPKLLISSEHMALNEILSGFSAQMQGDGTTLLLSSEDFETCLVEPELAVKFEELARDSGFGSLNWIFVLREPWEYFNSLYSEMSKHGISANYHAMAQQILEHGSLSCTNKNFRWRFAFDYARFLNTFSGQVSADVSVFSFNQFKENGLGVPLFKLCFDSITDTEDFLAAANGKGKQENERLRPDDVEFNYTCNFLGVSAKHMRLKRLLFTPIIHLRRRKIASKKNELEVAFRKRMSEWSAAGCLDSGLGEQSAGID